VYVCTAPISTTLLPSSLSLREFFLHSLDSRSINPPSLGGILLLLDGVSQSRQIDTHTPPTTTAPVGGPPVRFQNKPQKNTTHFLLLTLYLWKSKRFFCFIWFYYVKRIELTSCRWEGREKNTKNQHENDFKINKINKKFPIIIIIEKREWMCNATPGSTDNKNHGREKMTCHFLLCQLLGKNFVQHFFFTPAFDVEKRQQLNTLYSTPSTCIFCHAHFRPFYSFHEEIPRPRQSLMTR
jgi:hypothetical protein